MIDWFRVIVDLERAGWSHERVAAECLRSSGWVQLLKDLTRSPRHDDGEALLALWGQATGRARNDAPQIKPVRNVRRQAPTLPRFETTNPGSL